MRACSSVQHVAKPKKVAELDEVQIKFFDSIVTPWRKLNSLLSEHPLAVNPDSNVAEVNARSLVVTLTHFRENNPETGGFSFSISDDLRNLANSTKHKKGSETAVSCSMAPTYECKNETFRFIRNEIICKYEEAQAANKDREFSASTEIWTAVQGYAQILNVDVSRFAPNESSYDFLPVAIAFSRPEYSAYTTSTRIVMLRKGAAGYERFDPADVKFVVLGEEAIGSDLTRTDWISMTKL